MQQVSPYTTDWMRLGPALVGHVHHVEAGLGVELGEREVRAGAVAGRGVVVLAGIGLHLVDEFLQRGGVDHLRVHGEHVGDVDQRRDRREVGLDVERQLLVERGVDAVRGRGAEQEGVAVGLGLRHGLGGDVAAGAGPVVDARCAGRATSRAAGCSMRATTSTPEPAGKPMKMVIGRLGQSSARSEAGKTSARTIATQRASFSIRISSSCLPDRGSPGPLMIMMRSWSSAVQKT